jgi:hypothetical protein
MPVSVGEARRHLRNGWRAVVINSTHATADRSGPVITERVGIVTVAMTRHGT